MSRWQTLFVMILLAVATFEASFLLLRSLVISFIFASLSLAIFTLLKFGQTPVRSKRQVNAAVTVLFSSAFVTMGCAIYDLERRTSPEYEAEDKFAALMKQESLDFTWDDLSGVEKQDLERESSGAVQLSKDYLICSIDDKFFLQKVTK